MNIKKILFWFGVGILSLFVLVAIMRMPYVIEAKRTKELVAEIHTTKLTLADVMGENLPLEPGEEADATVAGVDANENGIRDDVELAIFEEYADSAKTRAALLQYALALQTQMTLPVVNTETVTATIKEEDRAYLCVGEVVSRDNLEEYIKVSENLRSFVEKEQINTAERINFRADIYTKLDSYTSLERTCDINYSNLSN